MKNSKLKKYFFIFGLCTILLTLAPCIAVDHWWIRIFDFPHLQLTTLTIISFFTYLIKFNFNSKYDYFFIIILFSCCAFQIKKIYPYTKLASPELETTKIHNHDKAIKIFTSNVLQHNTAYNLLLSEIKNYDPDIVLLTETNDQWKKNIAIGLPQELKYRIEYPLENTYGMCLYSKIPLDNSEVKFLVDDSIPSIHTQINLDDQKKIQIFAIHPTPPLPQHNPKSTDRDAELMKVALKCNKSNVPTIVLGDFNDVAWSESTENFKKVGGLLDLRIGRGLYNTYHADYWFLRWPLDHIFVSPHFRFIEAKRGNDVGSDHFPIMVKLSFEPENKAFQKTEVPDADLIKEAKEQIMKEIIEDRD